MTPRHKLYEELLLLGIKDAGSIIISARNFFLKLHGKISIKKYVATDSFTDSLESIVLN